MNRLMALFLFLVLGPIFILISLIILIEDGFPIFFKQQRVGQNNNLFNIFKFRTMKKNTPNVATHLLNNPDSFLLKTGRVLRKLSLDEMPNLINIIFGDMVFVGPRPALFNQYDLVTLRKEAGIDKLKPGITGWAQINGRDEISIEVKVELEKEYLNKKTLLFDMVILFKTFTKVIESQGVSH
ncbi:sugar transferase [Aquirufa antheringensis]